MAQIRKEKIKHILQETSELLQSVYRNRLKAVILYGSFARGTQREDSDMDIMVLVDGTDAELREYNEKLSDISTDLALKYRMVFSIMDVKYQEYMEWKSVCHFIRTWIRKGLFSIQHEVWNMCGYRLQLGKEKLGLG